jgi:drug/metabolite transporter (DMT)-like permease
MGKLGVISRNPSMNGTGAPTGYFQLSTLKAVYRHISEGEMENLRGILFMVVAMGAFAVEDALIKSTTQTIPTAQLALSVGSMGTVALLILCRIIRVPLLNAALLHPAVIARNLADIVGVVFFISALALAPLTTLAALIQVTPLALTFCAALLLGEHVGWRRWTAVFVGFAGMLLIIKPGSDAFDSTTLLAVGAVVCLTARDLATRFVPKDMHNLQLTTYGFSTMIPAGLVLWPFAEATVSPTGLQWSVLAIISTLGLIGYYAVTAAMRLGEVSVISPFRYTRLILAMIIGLVFFNETPDTITWIGAGMIVTAGLYLLYREAVQRRTQTV